MLSSKVAVMFCIPTSWLNIDLIVKCCGTFQFLPHMISLLHWYCYHPSFATLGLPLVSVTHSLFILLPSLKRFLSLIQGLTSHWSLKCCRPLRFYPWLSALLVSFSSSQHRTPAPPTATHMLLCCLETGCSKPPLASATFPEAPNS